MYQEKLIIHHCGGNPKDTNNPAISVEGKVITCESFSPGRKYCLNVPMKMEKMNTLPWEMNKNEATCQNIYCRFNNPKTDINVILFEHQDRAR